MVSTRTETDSIAKRTVCANLLAAHLICPILFFTDLTRNPYYTQIIILNIAIICILVVWLLHGIYENKIMFRRTFLDVPILVFLAVATFSLGVSWYAHPPFFRSSVVNEGVRVWLFIFLNCFVVYWIATQFVDRKWYCHTGKYSTRTDHRACSCCKKR